jgi:5-methylcytosine-specific restriction endonuclease McrA
MSNTNPIGYAIRFNETENTFKHLDILREYGEVLWGQWRKPGGKITSSSIRITEDLCTIYAIGQTTVWNMHVKEVLSKKDILERHLEFLIPSYYSIDTECYCWYLVDDIKDYEGKECLNSLFTSGGNPFSIIHQIPGNSPFRVYSTGNNIVPFKTFIPKVIPRAYNAERAKMSASLRYSILKRDHFKCVLCGRTPEEDGVKLHVDHIIPISKGGKTEYDNLRTLCQDCNLGKSDTMPSIIDGKLVG